MKMTVVAVVQDDVVLLFFFEKQRESHGTGVTTVGIGGKFDIMRRILVSRPLAVVTGLTYGASEELPDLVQIVAGVLDRFDKGVPLIPVFTDCFEALLKKTRAERASNLPVGVPDQVVVVPSRTHWHLVGVDGHLLPGCGQDDTKIPIPHKIPRTREKQVLLADDLLNLIEMNIC
jgi:hypothetical protein